MNCKRMNRRGFEFSFGWLFAILVGAAFLTLALYGVSRLVQTERTFQDTQAGKQLGILLNPFGPGEASGKLSSVDFQESTRIFNRCVTPGSKEGPVEQRFGAQDISIATQAGIGKTWQDAGVPSTYYNAYIFSPAVLEGKHFEVFSKSLYLPYKIADVFFIPEGQYCFVQPPRTIQEELQDFAHINAETAQQFLIKEQARDCPKESVSVCFSGSGCVIDVDILAQRVRKKTVQVYYGDDPGHVLLYGSIFGDPGIYTCQLQRLLARTAELALVYQKTSQRLSSQGCSSNLEQELQTYSDLAKNMKISSELPAIITYSEELGRRNELLDCKLF